MDGGRRTTDDGPRTTDDGRQTTDDGQRYTALRTPHSALRTPHSALRTPHSAPRTPHLAPLPYPLPTFLSLLTALPFVILAQRSLPAERRPYSRLTLLALPLYFLLDRLLPYAPGLRALPQPWGVMGVRFVLIALTLWVTGAWRQAGLQWNTSPRAWRTAAWMTAAMLAFTLGRNALLRSLGLSQAEEALSLPYLLYLGSLPGLAEEFVYRGLFQPQLNRLYDRPWRLFGAPLGWGWLITAILFWAMHAWRAAPGGRVVFYWPTLTMQLWIGLGLGLLREQTESVWPGVIAHNLVNLAWVVG